MIVYLSFVERGGEGSAGRRVWTVGDRAAYIGWCC